MLGPLFGAAAKLLDLPLHGGNLLFLLAHLEFEGVFSLLPRLETCLGNGLLSTLFDSQLNFTFGVVQFARLFEKVSLGLLRLCQFGTLLGDPLIGVSQVSGCRVQGVGHSLPGPLGLLGCDLAAFGFNLGGDLSFELSLGFIELLALLIKVVSFSRHFGVFGRKPILISFSSRGQQRSGKGFGELDVGLAAWTGDQWFHHGRLLDWGGQRSYRR